MWRRSWKKVTKTIFDVIVSLGMFTALMAFHLISFVAFLLFSTSAIIGISLIYSYFVSTTPPVPIQNCLILSILTYMSKYQLIFYYKLIYPGDNYERHCWSFIIKVMKLIYAIVASYAFIQIIELHWTHNLVLRETGDGNSTNDEKRHQFVEEMSSKSEFRLKSIMVSLLWDSENRSFLMSMAILVHLFNMCLYTDYSALCKYVPILKTRCIIAITYSVTLQTCYFTLCFFEFYIVHSWVPYNWIDGRILLYAIVVQTSLLLWILQTSLFELLTERACSLVQRNGDPFYWFQNMARGRILTLNFVLLPFLINLFYTKEDYGVLLSKVLKWKGTVVPIDNYNRSVFFFAFFCSTIVHSLKTLMLLKNGLARLVFTGLVCYFRLYDLTTCYDCQGCCCCARDEDDDTSLSSSWGTTTVSEITEEDESNSINGDTDRNDKGHGQSHKRKRRRSKGGRDAMISREHFGDHKGRANERQPEEDVDKVNVYAAVNKSGVGDSQWTPQTFSFPVPSLE